MKFIHMLALSFLVAGAGWSSAFAAGQPDAPGDPVVSPGVQDQTTDDDYRTGPFHGFDQAHGAVWINDRLYWMHPEFQVIGTPTKLGLLSAIKPGESVEFITLPDPADGRRTLILEIRRK